MPYLRQSRKERESGSLDNVSHGGKLGFELTLKLGGLAPFDNQAALFQRLDDRRFAQRPVELLANGLADLDWPLMMRRFAYHQPAGAKRPAQ